MPGSSPIPFQTINNLPLYTAIEGPWLVPTPGTNCCGAHGKLSAHQNLNLSSDDIDISVSCLSAGKLQVLTLTRVPLLTGV